MPARSALHQSGPADPRPSHTSSWYAASVPAAAPHAPLAGALECDVCVIGGGISGCSAALHLAERGYSVALLEAARVGFGGSGRSGGQLITGYSVAQDKLDRLVGKDDARRLWTMSLEAVALARERIERHDIECDLRLGYLHAAVKPRQMRELEDWQHELENDLDYRGLALLDRDALRGRLNSERFCGALSDPNSGHLHPLAYTQGLARAATAAGVQLFEASAVTAVEAGPPARIRTAGGEVHARYVLLCANAYLDGLEPSIAARIMPVGTYIVATESLGEKRAESLLPRREAVADLNFVLDYFRLSGDHRLLFGGRVSYSNLDPPSVADSVRKRMCAAFPALADVRIEYAWGGHVAITMNRAPHFGRLAPNYFFVQGFSGHGMALSGLAGKLMAEAVAGTAERFDLLARIPHAPFPGGPLLRRPALVLAMLYYRLRDLI